MMEALQSSGQSGACLGNCVHTYGIIYIVNLYDVGVGISFHS